MFKNRFKLSEKGFLIYFNELHMAGAYMIWGTLPNKRIKSEIN